MKMMMMNEDDDDEQIKTNLNRFNIKIGNLKSI
jgi:hypothetical protein